MATGKLIRLLVKDLLFILREFSTSLNSEYFNHVLDF